MTMFRWVVDSFSTVFQSNAERKYRALCKTRVYLTDQDFFDQFYRDGEISFDTCSRVRRVLETQLGISNVRREDCLTSIFSDLDLREICFEVAHEFGAKFPENLIQSMDGTVDSLIRVMEELRAQHRHP